MPIQHRRPPLGLLRLAIAIAIAVAGASSTLAQDGLEPLGPEVEIDQQCVYRPAVLASEGQVVVAWSRSTGPAGIFARSGTSLSTLGPAVQLATVAAAREIQLAAQPGGFVLGWNSFGEPSNAFYRRFDFDLAPLAPAVDLGRAYAGQSPALLVSPAGEVTFAFFDFTEHDLRVQRFSAADAPLTALLYVDAASGSTTPTATVRLAAGDSGFLVAWSGGTPGLTGGPTLWVRALGWDGLPAGPSSQLASLGPPDFDVAWAQGFYVVVRYFTDIWAHRIAADGAPLSAGEVLVPSVLAYSVRLSEADDHLWLTTGISSGGSAGHYAARVALPEVAAGPLDLLLPAPADPNEFYIHTGVAPTAEGLLLAWQFGAFSGPVCAQTQAVRAQEFGPVQLTAVPMLTPPALAGLVALLAVAGLALLRRS